MKHSIFLIIILSLFSCASLPEPGQFPNAIIVGELAYIGKGFNDSGGTGRTVNGTATYGIEITIKNLATSESYFFRTWGNNGFFCGGLKPGNYAITKLNYKDEGELGSSQIWVNPQNYLFFSVTSEAVNNLGKIKWLADADNGMNFSANIDYQSVKYDFGQKYVRSGWNVQKWTNVKFGETIKENKFPKI